MISELNKERGRDIVALKSQGKTYRQIASLMNLKFQRVEQIHKAFIKWVNSSLDNRKADI